LLTITIKIKGEYFFFNLSKRNSEIKVHPILHSKPTLIVVTQHYLSAQPQRYWKSW